MEHYYSENPESESNEKEITYEINGKKFKFISDNGVFSKGHVDFATDFMLRMILKDEINGKVLDMGCGYGVIGITISKLCGEVSKVVMCDINNRAVDLSKRNVINNKVVNAEVIASNGFENVNDKFDVIITNPPIRAGKAVIYKMYEDAKLHLNDGGKFYLVINKKHGAPSTINYLNEIYSNVEVLDKKAGFNVIRCMGNA